MNSINFNPAITNQNNIDNLTFGREQNRRQKNHKRNTELFENYLANKPDIQKQLDSSVRRVDGVWIRYSKLGTAQRKALRRRVLEDAYLESNSKKLAQLQREAQGRIEKVDSNNWDARTGWERRQQIWN